MIFAAYIYCITHIGISIAAQATVLSMPGIVVPRFPLLPHRTEEQRKNYPKTSGRFSIFPALFRTDTKK